MHAQQRDAVGEHVVHLARDPRSLVGPCALGVLVLRGLGALRPLAQRGQQLAARAHVHADRGDGDVEQDDAEQGEPQLGPQLGAVARLQRVADRQRRQPERADPQHDREPAVQRRR